MDAAINAWMFRLCMYMRCLCRYLCIHVCLCVFPGLGWAIRGAPPGTLHQTWQSEDEATSQPCMDWALWVLDCFLENCPTDVLYERGGILSGQTYEALIKVGDDDGSIE